MSVWCSSSENLFDVLTSYVAVWHATFVEFSKSHDAFGRWKDLSCTAGSVIVHCRTGHCALGICHRVLWAMSLWAVGCVIVYCGLCHCRLLSLCTVGFFIVYCAICHVLLDLALIVYCGFCHFALLTVILYCGICHGVLWEVSLCTVGFVIVWCGIRPYVLQNLSLPVLQDSSQTQTLTDWPVWISLISHSLKLWHFCLEVTYQYK